ncbi:MAG: FadR family transcriptional regulator [Spirochaetaceae bacterium]|nr:MAG: FadR family transcriptional regulator [Spirochaetaceae bacterium]
MARKNILDHFEKVELPDPVDLVIQQIKDLIHAGVLNPGDRLPSEKSIEEKMQIPRGPISKALRRLETYGILKTIPQSGTYVASIGVDALEGLLTNVLKLEDRELEALDDTRYVLEIYAAELVSERSTDQQINELAEVQQEVAEKIEAGASRFDEDMVFHLKIADICGNPILKSIITMLVSDVLQFFKEFEQKAGSTIVRRRLIEATDEHRQIVAAVKERDPHKAAEAMRRHFQISKEFRSSVIRELNRQ